MSISKAASLTALATEAAGELDVLALDGDTLGVDGAEVGVLEEGDEVGLDGLLKSTDGRGLEAEIGLEVLGDLTDKTLEGQLADEELSRLLVATDLTESDGSGLVAVRLLDTTGTRGGLPGSLGGKPWRHVSGLRWCERQNGSTHCLRGALPPVDLRAVCLVRAMLVDDGGVVVVDGGCGG